MRCILNVPAFVPFLGPMLVKISYISIWVSHIVNDDFPVWNGDDHESGVTCFLLRLLGQSGMMTQ